MDNKTYTATLTLSSTAAPNSPMELKYEWDPPLKDAFAELGDEANMPASYQMMGYILEQAVFPTIALNERYEAEFLDGSETKGG